MKCVRQHGHNVLVLAPLAHPACEGLSPDDDSQAPLLLPLESLPQAHPVQSRIWLSRQHQQYHCPALNGGRTHNQTLALDGGQASHGLNKELPLEHCCRFLRHTFPET